jgi:pimeloyl-ACP methyl ester carboxylesterase
MEHVTSADRTTIAFDRSGSGPPVIVVGGAFNDRAMAAPVAALLSTRFTVYAYDRRGRGDSGDTPPYAVAREVEDLDALVAEAGGSAFAYGHSSGAGLILEAAAAGVALSMLAVYEPPFIVDDTRPPLPKGFATQIDELLASGRRGDVVERFMTDAAVVPADLVAQMRQAPIWAALEHRAHTLPYDLAIMGERNALPAERLAAVTAPALVLDGAASPAWMRNAARAVADALPHAEARSIEGQAHDVAPELVAPVLAEFFAGAAERAA